MWTKLILLPSTVAMISQRRTQEDANSTVATMFPACSSLANTPCLSDHLEPVEWTTTLVQVTPTECANHRDGAWTAALLLENLQYVSVIAGSFHDENYDEQHRSVLTTLLDTLEVDYIVGTCSPVAQVEPPLAAAFQTILLAQVQLSTFYASGNPYLFGISLSTDVYPTQFIQALAFVTSLQTPIHIIYQSTSDSHLSMCQSAYESLLDRGFTNVQKHSYETASEYPKVGHRICTDAEPPILFVCAEELTDFPCPPRSIWMPNPPSIPNLIGAVQGHGQLPFQDTYFESTEAFWNYTKVQFNYPGNYEQVVSYSIPQLAAQHYAYHASLQSPLQLYQTLPSFSTETLMGPIRFDALRRNVGRESVTIQWRPNSESVLVAPLSQAQGNLELTAPSAIPCVAGSFWDMNQARSLLESACTPCPVNTYLDEESQASECIPCPTSTSTLLEMGQTYCVGIEDRSVSSQVLIIGYVATAFSWLISAAASVRWMKQKDRTAFLCVGSFLSTSAFLAWSLQTCEAVPFLYVVGWMFQSWSLTTMRGWEGVVLLVDLAVATAWTLINPLVVRTVSGEVYYCQNFR